MWHTDEGTVCQQSHAEYNGEAGLHEEEDPNDTEGSGDTLDQEHLVTRVTKTALIY